MSAASRCVFFPLASLAFLGASIGQRGVVGFGKGLDLTRRRMGASSFWYLCKLGGHTYIIQISFELAYASHGKA